MRAVRALRRKSATFFQEFSDRRQVRTQLFAFRVRASQSGFGAADQWCNFFVGHLGLLSIYAQDPRVWFSAPDAEILNRKLLLFEPAVAAALRYLGQATEQRHPRAQQLLGQMYENGYGVRQNLELAVQYFEAAAA
jgi:TPR repeat protein